MSLPIPSRKYAPGKSKPYVAAHPLFSIYPVSPVPRSTITMDGYTFHRYRVRHLDLDYEKIVWAISPESAISLCSSQRDFLPESLLAETHPYIPNLSPIPGLN